MNKNTQFGVLYISTNGYSYGCIDMVDKEKYDTYRIDEINVFERLSIIEILKLNATFNYRLLFVNNIPGITNQLFHIRIAENFDEISSIIILKCLINDEKLIISENLKDELNKYELGSISLEIAPLFLLAANYDTICSQIGYWGFITGD